MVVNQSALRGLVVLVLTDDEISSWLSLLP